MPLSNAERQVLTLICDEHRQTRRGAKTSIVHVGMNAANSQQKARIVDVLLALKKRGLVVFGHEAWMPTSEGEGALWAAASQAVSIEPEEQQEASAQSRIEASPDQLQQVESRSFTTEEVAQEKQRFVDEQVEEITRCIFGTDRIGADLLNRCAAMNATLMAQAKQAHEQGEPDAWRDLHWLMETAQQLVALGGGE